MNLLLDTHVLLWWVSGDQLDPEASTQIADPANLVCVSAASVWEMSIKQTLGKLRLDGDIDTILSEDFEPVPITFDDARRAGLLPEHHRDLFDRMLVAQAQARDLVLVSRDLALEPYDVQILWA
ncbi:MAG: type II toxin-antitoxin system VapC family toxin [Acidimicrobiia bacterium]|nr:type II toxin-antitoxin system VapC family toxin [Acidimicrobiia bacterium]MYC45337.1 type II toxin-antitoxin system VapC family toxin [Acidimicrobiia bacterium]